MLVSPLNLISTPVPVLNTLGLNLRVGLSSEDPQVGRHPSEAYEVYLSIYSPEGEQADRMHLGKIPPNRRRFFDISTITRKLVPDLDHLTVVHRIPSRLLSQGSNVKDEIEMTKEPDYSLVRSLIEYSYPQGGNGSVIYETPPQLNGGGKSSNTLTFTCQTLLSENVNTYVGLIHYSVNPSYSHIATYNFALYSLSGERVVSDHVAIGRFAIEILDIAQLVPKHIVEREKDPQDGLSAFNFVGFSDEQTVLVVVINAAPALGGIAVEHTHPPQTYLFPFDGSQQRKVKSEAMRVWKAIISGAESK